MPTEASNVSRAGITTSATGERHIPSSIRPDGSVRKEIRVRPGYRPPEDVELYKNRTAEAYKNRGQKLAKKLRQARDLQDKKEKGDALLPEQFQKVVKINELIRQLETLGFDSNGDKKSTEAES
ncbi:unnamed protein product [Aureobasidium mustum]|uniref:WIBG Mago-binding domain-containing protein n=1 Tax=Aureobasidium mustum TaxID=2773714 RepID=A0A9N8JX18_9PEZI|nr:unnamed protein product [Aureobasidium mustum]